MGKKEEKKKPTKVKKKVTVEKTRIKKTKLIQPMKFTMATLREFQVHKTTGNETAELCHAADSFDEWVRRDIAEKLVGVLTEKHKETQEKEEKKKVRITEQQERKRKREEKQE